MVRTATLVWMLALLFFVSGCSRGPKHPANYPPTGTTVVCFGDSLTYGEGARPNESYPEVLAGLLGRRVINAGISGDTTREALNRIERDVLPVNAALVIVEFGANDHFTGIPVKETLANLERMVDMIEAKGAMVAIAEVNVGVLHDPYLAGFREIARQKGALLIPNIMRGIITDPSLKSDQMHPNGKGYAVIARRIFESVKPSLQ